MYILDILLCILQVPAWHINTTVGCESGKGYTQRGGGVGGVETQTSMHRRSPVYMQHRPESTYVHVRRMLRSGIRLRVESCQGYDSGGASS